MTGNLNRIRQVLSDPTNIGPVLALSRRMFGNNAGLKQNVYGNLELWNSRHRGPFSHLVRTNETARAIDEVGYVKATWRYSGELVDRIQKQFEENIEAGKVSVQRNPDGGILNIAAKDVIHTMPAVKEFLHQPLLDVVRAYFGSNVRVYKPDFWRNFHAPAEVLAERERYSERWHNDSGKTSILSILILMSDVTEDHGPTWCISRPHTRKLMQGAYNNRDKAPEKLLSDGAGSMTKFLGRRGDAWLLNTRRSLHRAGIPAAGLHRDMLGLKFTPTAAQTDVWDEIPTPEEKHLVWQHYSS